MLFLGLAFCFEFFCSANASVASSAGASWKAGSGEISSVPSFGEKGPVLGIKFVSRGDVEKFDG